jgi:hypothetical protein
LPANRRSRNSQHLLPRTGPAPPRYQEVEDGEILRTSRPCPAVRRPRCRPTATVVGAPQRPTPPSPYRLHPNISINNEEAVACCFHRAAVEREGARRHGTAQRIAPAAAQERSQAGEVGQRRLGFSPGLLPLYTPVKNRRPRLIGGKSYGL